MTRLVVVALAFVPPIAVARGDIFSLGFLAFPVVGAIVLWNRPRNTIGWLVTLVGSLAPASVLVPSITADAIVIALPMKILSQLNVVAIGLVPFLILLFPTGHLPSHRWRWPARLGGAAVAFVLLLQVVRVDAGEFAFRVRTLQPLVEKGLLPAVNVIALFGIAALVNVFARLRRATGDEREQLRWFAFPTAMLPALMFVNGAAQGQSWQGVVLVVAFTVGFSGIAVGVGIAVLKFHLYAIDAVINKTVVYGALAAFVTLVYLTIVVGIGSQFTSERSNPVLSIAATVVVAYAFQPLRHRLQGFANRLVYGQRLSPYEAVSSFTRRVTESFSLDRVLPEMAEAAALGVGAARSRVRLVLPSGSEHVVMWPADQADEGFDRVLPVVHNGEEVGDIAVAKARGEQMTKQDEILLADLVSEASLAMASLRLTEELQHRLVELQESRLRIVSAQDEERRRMERDLHDGAQQQLIAMKIKLGLLDGLIDASPSQARTLVTEIAQDSSDAVKTLRDLARGLFPTVLVQRGLAAAVESHVEKSGVDAVVTVAPDFPRLRLDLEANVYFVIREALQNASKYAPGAAVEITLRADDSTLVFGIRDDGPGFDAAQVTLGNGTQNMRDRVEALGGSLAIVSVPPGGTSVQGVVPIALSEPRLVAHRTEAAAM